MSQAREISSYPPLWYEVIDRLKSSNEPFIVGPLSIREALKLRQRWYGFLKALDRAGDTEAAHMGRQSICSIRNEEWIVERKTYTSTALKVMAQEAAKSSEKKWLVFEPYRTSREAQLLMAALKYDTAAIDEYMRPVDDPEV